MNQRKIMISCLFICVILFLSSGCAWQSWSQDWEEYTDDTGKGSSRINGAFDYPVVACLDDIIAYPIEGGLRFYDTEEEKLVKSSFLRNENEGFLGISAGKEYFYVLIEKEEKIDKFESLISFYLRLYHPDGSIYQEVPVPFKSMFASDGMVYGYYDPDDDRVGGFDCKTGHIEATHYLSEEKFLTDFPVDVSDWIQMSGDTLQIGSKTFYHYPPDGYMHQKAYYSDDKYLKQIQQFYFTEYIDGELATPPERAMYEENLEGLYALMKKKEKNWITFACEVDGVMYGVCNIYKSSSDFLTQMDTSGIDYSISFFYNESTETLDKIDEYENVELIYVDEKHVLTHKEDGVYYTNRTENREEKILDYDGAIGVNVRDNLLLVRKNESYVGNGDEQEFYWGKDTRFVKKLWEE